MHVTIGDPQLPSVCSHHVSDTETRTQAIGHDLLRDARRRGSGEPWLDRLLMYQGMKDEQVKAELFRFVDVLPTLTHDRQITAHLKEYLGTVATRLPPFAATALRMLPDGGMLGGIVADVARLGATRMARRFIAASDLPGAIEAVESLRARNLAFTIDLLGEAVLSIVEARRYQGLYLKLIEGLSAASKSWPHNALVDEDPSAGPAANGKSSGAAGVMPPVNVSVKLSSLYSQFDPIDPDGTSREVRDQLRPILRLARNCGVFVNIDMEQFSYKDVTLQIFKEVFEEPEFRDWPHVGIAIQAYLTSSGDDLRDLANWAERRGTPVWVRLVKGAYWDYETVIAAQNDWPIPVFTEKAATDANFEKLTTFLFDHHQWLRPAIASHNIRSIAHALAEAEARELPPGSFEFQMLFGMAEPIKATLIELGHRVRVYTPFGQLLPGMAYLVRRLLENTSNESFLKAGFADNVSEERLLMNPTNVKSGARTSTSASSLRHEAGGTTPRFRNEPLTDFTRPENRTAMRSALDAARRRLGETLPIVIGGRRIETGRWVDSVNPAWRGEIVARGAAATAEIATSAIDIARDAFPAWRDTPAGQRADLLRKVALILRRDKFALAALEVFETGKQWREADADIAEAIDFCHFCADEMQRLTRPHRRDIPGEDNEYFYEPRGVAVVIAPWNFPLAILCGMTAAALVAGNTVIMKPAEQSPAVSARLMDAFEEAGVPKGVVNYLPGIGEEVGPVLVKHPDTSLIAFTGSRAVGMLIARQAAELAEGQEQIKRVIAELGGKNAVIVDDDADLDEAVHGVVASAFGYSGQKCSACSRVIVLDSVYETFLSRLVESTRSLEIGPAENPGYYLGPVIDDEAQRRILAMIDRARRQSRLAYQADVSALASEGSYVPPTIFADVSPSASIAQEEVFGPVLAVIRAADLTDALRIANGTKYALTGGLFSRSPANIDRVRREFRVGNLYINRKITGALVDRQPFGGFKLSGVGSKAGGPDYLQQFLIPRVITENTLRRGFAPAVDE
ncbi:L-glutamate gamma-semialdehyde dehydrogenase [Humisphaera borealis]|uniref:L-glutamate gamma-semialdehyde dehydrogenase n=1 Tax=Humisphaera borealis TaxID=2807512 RepID=A0A7M2X0H6_9BACT|nr:L-glutamate gamma-semialdehyde dehydrogenase [Humisphaera borealis]QOV91154.1 L-glutamate gamma-semialdehyde dehydrogenase [Humisphaera borealis]